MPYEDLVALQDRKGTDPLTTRKSLDGPPDTPSFLQSVGLTRHLRKLKHLDLYQLAAMNRLDFKTWNISSPDARKILRVRDFPVVVRSHKR